MRLIYERGRQGVAPGSTCSLVVVLGACLQLRVDVGSFLRTHGRVEEALDYRKQELKEAQQSGELCELE